VHDLRDAVGDGDADEIDVALEDGVGSADLHGDAVGDDVAVVRARSRTPRRLSAGRKGSRGRRAARSPRAGGASPLG
jgi:hypothetical protein